MGTLTLNRFYRRNYAEREDEKFSVVVGLQI